MKPTIGRIVIYRGISEGEEWDVPAIITGTATSKLPLGDRNLLDSDTHVHLVLFWAGGVGDAREIPCDRRNNVAQAAHQVEGHTWRWPESHTTRVRTPSSSTSESDEEENHAAYS